MIKINVHQSLYKVVLDASKRDPKSPALIFYHHHISWTKFISRVNQFAHGLKNDGVKKGDVVTLLLPNIPEGIYLIYAVSQIGAILNPLHPLLPKEEIIRTIGETKSKILFCLNSRYDEFKDLDGLVYDVTPAHELPAFKRLFARQGPCQHECPYYACDELHDFEPMEHEDAVYMNSGGTTGVPKIVRLSSFAINSLIANAPWIVGDVKDTSGMLCVMPIFHGFGLAVGVHFALGLGYRAVLMPKFSRKDAVRSLAKKEYSVLIGIPIFYEKLLRYPGFAGKKLRNLDVAFVGGDFLNPTLTERFNQRMVEGGSKCRLYEGYGLTETVSLFSVNTPFVQEQGSVGQPMPNVSCRVLDEHFKDVKPGENGELFCTGDTLMNGYLNAEAKFYELDGKKYVATGDSVHLSKDGFIYFNQRIKRIIKVSGIPIFPHEVESIVGELPIIYETVAIGVDDVKHGQLLKLYIVLNKHYNGSVESAEQEIRDVIKSKVGIYANPKEIVFLEKMPHTSVGKIDVKQLQ